MAQVDLASVLNTANRECPLTCFIPKGNWGWSPRGFPGPSLDDKLGVIPCVTERLHLLYILLESFARRRLLYCLSLWNLFYTSSEVLMFMFVCLFVCYLFVCLFVYLL